MSDVYKAREHVVLQQFAWQTLNDPKASDEDKRAARARLERPPRKKLNWDRLDHDELHLLNELYRKLESDEGDDLFGPAVSWRVLNDPTASDRDKQDARDRLQLANAREWALSCLASSAQYVADKGLAALDKALESADQQTRDTYGRHARNVRCETCSRYYPRVESTTDFQILRALELPNAPTLMRVERDPSR